MGGKVLVSTDEAIQQAGGGAPRRRRHRRAHRAHRAHRRRRGDPAALQSRPARRAFPDRRALQRGFLPRQGRHRAGHRSRARRTRRTRTWCGAKPQSPTSRRRVASPRPYTPGIPDKLLAYNCSPSFNWQKNVDAATMRRWREELAAMGYRFQFITLAGWHALNLSMFELASGVSRRGHVRLLAAAAARVRPGERGLPRRQAPGLRRHRLLRCGTDRGHRRSILDRRHDGQHRRRAVHGRAKPALAVAR